MKGGDAPQAGEMHPAKPECLDAALSGHPGPGPHRLLRRERGPGPVALGGAPWRGGAGGAAHTAGAIRNFTRSTSPSKSATTSRNTCGPENHTPRHSTPRQTPPSPSTARVLRSGTARRGCHPKRSARSVGFFWGRTPRVRHCGHWNPGSNAHSWSSLRATRQHMQRQPATSVCRATFGDSRAARFPNGRRRWGPPPHEAPPCC